MKFQIERRTIGRSLYDIHYDGKYMATTITLWGAKLKCRRLARLYKRKPKMVIDYEV